MTVLTTIAKGIAGGLFCSLIWWAMDRYLFHDPHDTNYYVAVVFAWAAGYGALASELRRAKVGR